ncbi:MAG TPA: DUF1318 domain-containing protein [Steroidobacteraceae bacterium]|jgi:Protein of unknown function (DUF1318).|nr:DUF1318 domain-containing protein [Steroidobacteraceae bacterium]
MLRHASKLIACCLVLSACVTINVYFPAAEAEKAADKIIDGIVGGAAPAEPAKREDNKQGAVREDSGPQRVLLAAAASVLDFIVPPAQAQANLNVDTPQIRALTQSMEARFAQMKKYFDSGSIGLARDGLVQVRDQNLVPLAERNVVRKLIAEDNADRSNLYKEMAAANGHPEWEADIRTTFAERWAARAASSGWYYQDASGAWTKK